MQISGQTRLFDAGLSGETALALTKEWFCQGRDAQQPPLMPWRTWVLMGGRGSGKTRTGAEWVIGIASGLPTIARDKCSNIALVGETLADVREVMVEGPSGILSVARRERPRLEATRRRLVWDNGAVASFFSSEDPDSLRGPQFDAAWCDELAKWKHPQETWDMLQFGLRLGHAPRQIVTTTPRPVALLRALLADKSVPVTRMRTAENAGHLAPGFVGMIEDRADALWSRGLIESVVGKAIPPLKRIVVAVDPPASAGRNSDACGIVAAGIDHDGFGWVLADESLPRAKPYQWARAAIALYHRLEADMIIAEINQGGDMVKAVIASEDHTVPVRAVRAMRGKWLRAEPVAALYEQRRIRHAGRFPALEDEMCDFAPGGLSNGRSPDRLDALVWALNELMLGRERMPRIRRME